MFCGLKNKIFLKVTIQYHFKQEMEIIQTLYKNKGGYLNLKDNIKQAKAFRIETA